jgi:glutaredoxin-like protein NrdH
VQCNQTKRLLERATVSYNSVDLSTDTEAMTMVKDLGYTAAPVVITDKLGHWSGFRLEKIKELVAIVKSEKITSHEF